MKNFKIVLSTLCVAVLAIAISSFTVKSYNKTAFAVQCYKVVSTVTIVTADLNTPTTAALNKWHDADANGVFDTTNWTSTTQTDINNNCPSTGKVCGICFDPGTTGYTLQNALDEIAAAISANPQTFTFGEGAVFTSPTTNVQVTCYEKQ